MKNDKKTGILNSAIELFRTTYNVKKVSLEEIAKAARVSPTTIYNIFSTREKLVVEIIKRLLRQNLDKSREIMYSDIPFPQKMAAIIAGKQDMLDQLNSELIEKILSQDADIQPLIDALYSAEIKPLWSDMLKDGKQQGYIDPALNDEALLIYLDVVKAGFMARQDLLKKSVTDPALLRDLTHLVFYGFLKKDVPLFQEEVKSNV